MLIKDTVDKARGNQSVTSYIDHVGLPQGISRTQFLKLYNYNSGAKAQTIAVFAEMMGIDCGDVIKDYIANTNKEVDDDEG